MEKRSHTFSCTHLKNDKIKSTDYCFKQNINLDVEEPLTARKLLKLLGKKCLTYKQKYISEADTFKIKGFTSILIREKMNKSFFCHY